MYIINSIKGFLEQNMKYIKKKKLPIITCPSCGYEYLPEEIYIPMFVFGKPQGIIRDENGKIEYFLDHTMNLSEDFICHKCGKKIAVTGTMQFSTKEVVKEQIESEYTTSRYRDTDKYNLSESNKIL